MTDAPRPGSPFATGTAHYYCDDDPCHECVQRQVQPARQREGDHEGIAGHCFDIDGQWWHEPGTCTTDDRCCRAQPIAESDLAALLAAAIHETWHDHSGQHPPRPCPDMTWAETDVGRILATPSGQRIAHEWERRP